MNRRIGKHRMLGIEGAKPFINTVEAYLNSPDDYVRLLTVHINGKKRHLITYKPDQKELLSDTSTTILLH